MNRYKRYSILLLIAALMIILQACSVNQNDTDTTTNTTTTATASTTATATEEIALTVEDSTTVVAVEPYTYRGYVDISLDLLQHLFAFDYADYIKYNQHFSNITQADLDGDGVDETIELLPGKQNEDSTYSSIVVSINGNGFELEADIGWSIGYGDSIFGSIIDVDKNDEYKELIIYQQADDAINGFLENASVIVYADKEPSVLVKWDGMYEANGSGYIIDTTYTKKLAGDYSIALLYIKKYTQNSGFEEIKMPVYGVLNYSSQIIGQQTNLLTQQDQYVAAKPGTEPDIMILENTRIHFGLYHESGWIEVYAADGSALGWLDLNVVDIDRYINYAIAASCH